MRNPKLIFTGGKRGWIGDSPFIFLDTKKIKIKSGWKPKYSINKSIKITTKYLLDNQWIMKRKLNIIIFGATGAYWRLSSKKFYKKK